MSAAEAPDYERDVVNEFKISNDLKDDIVYCQKVLRSYIKVHQVNSLVNVCFFFDKLQFLSGSFRFVLFVWLKMPW